MNPFCRPIVVGILAAETLVGSTVLASASLKPTSGPLNLLWYDMAAWPLEGKGWTDTPTRYHRLPARVKDHVTSPVWTLAANTSGLTLRFVTDATTMAAQWDGGEPMNHMAATGSHGLDLYERKNETWTYVGTGRPRPERTTATLVRGRTARPAEFLLYLPTYGPVTTLTLGLNPGARLLPAPPRKNPKPIVFYGTSITQAGCASRSGMGHTSILGRWLDHDVINLGFSGSGKTEPIMAELLAELDAALFVLEPLPNMTVEQVRDRIPPALAILRAKRPTTPILLVENPLMASDHPQNLALQKVYQEARQKGDQNLHLLPSKGQLEGREEGTVDGIHPTDLGFLRMATVYEPVIRKLLNKKP